VYEMVIADAGGDTLVVVDGRVLCAVTQGDRIRVRRADVRFRLVAGPGHSYYRTLREKLGWGGRLRKDRNQS